MPSSRQYKVLGFIALLSVLIVYYVSSGASSTQTSQFYQRTAASLKSTTHNVKDAAARQHILEDERAHADRVERLRKEHDVATEKANVVGGGEKMPPVAGGAAPAAAATRKKEGKVVEHPPAEGYDGVAKVGNVEPKKSPAVHVSEKETDAEHETEDRLTFILKQGPIIVFSKSYCPYSKKAKVKYPPNPSYKHPTNKRKAHPPRPLHHHPNPLRRRTRPRTSRARSARRFAAHHRPSYGAQYSHQWPVRGRWR
jgi:hypothetical protein